MPLFSIVIPTRNRADLLKLAIDSALAQEGDLEVVVCDND
ncbi:MAG: glycosyltransferase, partial [Caldilineaceae bacterium]|nr:glycosyltransferase [Caldilineaceae bacterium]